MPLRRYLDLFLSVYFKEESKLNGEKTFFYKPHKYSKNHQVSGSKYIPLKDRTKTLADIQDLDSTRNRESVERIRDDIVKEQIAIRILDEFLE